MSCFFLNYSSFKEIIHVLKQKKTALYALVKQAHEQVFGLVYEYYSMK